MNPPNAVTACRNLFKIQPFLAHGIIPALRVEDVKIALAKKLHETTDRRQIILPADQIKDYLDSYAILTEYIKRHNIEVILSLDNHTDASADGCSYLFPNTDAAKTLSARRLTVLSKKEIYFSGAVPPRRLRFGTFLYYRGLISYYHVMESIAWQKERRPLIGQMAMQIGKLTPDKFARIIVQVKNGECFGRVARAQKLLSDHVIAALVKAQEKYDCRIGRYFIEKKLFSSDELQKLEREMRKHNGNSG
ncbi:MAG: hypothetical protein JXA18_16580 [Chitinispirillaceae bacterium]|nr:hypothetical protein [Chitinispirillaceae bacterium]